MWEYMQFTVFLFYFKYITFQGFQSPLTFLTLHLLVLQIFLYIRSSTIRRENKRRNTIPNHAKSSSDVLSEKDDLSRAQPVSPPASRLEIVAAGTTTALSLASLLLAVTRIRSVTFAYMLLPLAEVLVLLTSLPSTVSTIGVLHLVITTTASLISVFLIVLGETSLDNTGLLLLATSGLFWAARCFLWHDIPGAFRKPGDLALVGAILVGFLAYELEDASGLISEVVGLDRQMVLMHVLANGLLSVGLVFPFSVSNSQEEKEDGSIFMSEDTFPLRTGVEGLLLMAIGRLSPSYIASSQIAGYVMLRVFVFQMRTQLRKHKEATSEISELGQTDTDRPSNVDIVDVESTVLLQTRAEKTFWSSAAYISIPVFIVLLLRVQFHLWLTESLSHPSHTTLDFSDDTVSRPFDVVISAHDNESPDEIRTITNSIESLDVFRGQSMRFIVYSNSHKFLNSTLSSHKYVESARSAYLTHIVDNWNNLAVQTVFISASDILSTSSLLTPSSKEAMEYRLSTSFIPDRTGFLSLSHRTEDTRCLSYPGASELVSAIQTGAECDEYSRIPITTSNFVASGRRIRGISKEVYETLLEDESLDTMWGLVMRCADERISAMCPTVSTGWWRALRDGGGQRREDECQCLDY